MADYNDLVKTFKQIALGAVDSQVPCAVMFGTVVSESPLKIKIDQKITLSSTQLVLCRNVTDYKTDMTVDHLTEKRAGGTQYALFEQHDHEYKGRKEFLVHHKLLSGDTVLLLRVSGGQKYVVVDRVVNV